MIYTSEEMERNAALETAARMMAAARTAPKTRGMDGLTTCCVTGEDKDRLAGTMRGLAEKRGKARTERGLPLLPL